MHVSKLVFIIIISVCLFSLAGCGGGAPGPNTNANNNAATKANSDNANAFVTTKGPETNKANDAAALAPVVLAYYEALKKKDDAAFRKVYSAAAIKELEAGMKAEGKKTLVDYIGSSEPAGDKPFEVRNEKIEGETAIAEIRGGSYATWIKWKFVKENGEWKLAPPSENIKLLGK
jgi:hypothetical protein